MKIELNPSTAARGLPGPRCAQKDQKLHLQERISTAIQGFHSPTEESTSERLCCATVDIRRRWFFEVLVPGASPRGVDVGMNWQSILKR